MKILNFRPCEMAFPCSDFGEEFGRLCHIIQVFNEEYSVKCMLCKRMQETLPLPFLW